MTIRGFDDESNNEERNYDTPFVWHEPIELEFNPDKLAVTFRFASNEPVPAREVAELVTALASHDKTLGGLGLMIDDELSSEVSGELCLVLLPLRPFEAPERFRQLAVALAVPLEAGVVPPNHAPTANGLCSSVDRHLRAPGSPPPLPLTALAEAVRKFQVRLHHLQAAG